MGEADVDWIDLLRAGDPPVAACWAKLVVELRGAAAELAAEAQRAQLTPEMAAFLRMLIAFNDYVQASAVLRAEPRLAAPILRLIAALYEVSQGKLPAAFKSAVRQPGG
ncbi:MAG: hypothetical protein JO047_06725 [Alphaproteobacteria bacterium]|nr:hypothetical protein [Alphaproteobacteria bacterium]